MAAGASGHPLHTPCGATTRGLPGVSAMALPLARPFALPPPPSPCPALAGHRGKKQAECWQCSAKLPQPTNSIGFLKWVAASARESQVAEPKQRPPGPPTPAACATPLVPRLNLAFVRSCKEGVHCTVRALTHAHGASVRARVPAAAPAAPATAVMCRGRRWRTALYSAI